MQKCLMESITILCLCILYWKYLSNQDKKKNPQQNKKTPTKTQEEV